VCSQQSSGEATRSHGRNDGCNLASAQGGDGQVVPCWSGGNAASEFLNSQGRCGLAKEEKLRSCWIDTSNNDIQLEGSFFTSYLYKKGHTMCLCDTWTCAWDFLLNARLNTYFHKNFKVNRRVKQKEKKRDSKYARHITDNASVF
jgi:hypothetical protein